MRKYSRLLMIMAVSFMVSPVLAVQAQEPLETPLPSAEASTLPSVTPSLTPSKSPAPTTEPVKKVTLKAQKGKMYKYGNVWYKVISKNSVRVVKPTSKKITTVTIPAKVKLYKDTFKVTAIDKKAFYRCHKLTRIIIKSKTIQSIGDKAFLKIGKRPQFQVPKGRYTRYQNILYGKKDWNAYIYYKSMKIVSASDSKYDYNDMQSDLTELSRYFGSVMGVRSIGTTYDNRSIYCISLGSASAKKQVVISAGIHAREWRNCHFLMEKLEYFLKNYDEKIYQGKTMTELLKDTRLYILPMVNPDGTAIAQYGPDAIRNMALRKKLKKMPGIKNYGTWKANARGVDLNRNFDTGWGSKKDKKKKPCDALYPGSSAASEVETKILTSFMNGLSNPQIMVSYHSTGEIIYFDYNVSGNLKTRIDAYAYRVQRLTGYMLIHGSSGTAANGGFGDWCAYVRRIPTVTIETGTVACPLPFSQMSRLRNKNKYIIESMLLGK